MAVNRQQRVARLKRIIILALLTAILLPTVLCIYLMVKVHGLEKELDHLNQTHAEILNREEQQVSSEPQQMNENIERADIVTSADGKEEADPAEEESKRKVYLTFDDGPSCYTEEILDILDRYGVKASFFVVGKEEANLRPIYAEIAKRGHTLGMHSYSHRYAEIYRSAEAFSKDFHMISDLIFEETGERPAYYRFPGGSSNEVSLLDMQEYIDCLDQEGITYFDWNITASDAEGKNLSKEQILANVQKDSEKYMTSVVLLHDTGQKRTTVEALPEIIEFYQKSGAELRAIDENTTLVQHRKSAGSTAVR